MRSYTSDELEQATGFDRRTIAYYVQEGLLPKVGRRGPRTRYPKLVRDRLLFIRRVREAEESGGVSPVSLSVMREIFERIPPELIASVADGQTPVTENIVSMVSVEARPLARRRAAIRERLAAMEDQRIAFEPSGAATLPGETTPPSSSTQSEDEEMSVAFLSLRTPSASEPAAFYEGERTEMLSSSRAMRVDPRIAESELGESLAALQEAALHRRKHASSSMDTWSRIEITPEIALSVRGVTDEDAGLLEKVAERLRQLINRRLGRRPDQE
jgi:DNA-binding transcriptional MerR regulator